MKKENLIKMVKDGGRSFGRLLAYCVLFVLVMAVVDRCLSFARDLFEMLSFEVLVFVVLGIYLLCAGLLYYKKKNDILLSWVYVVVLLCAVNLEFWFIEVCFVCLTIMSLLLIYQLYAWIAKKKMLAVWWFAPHVCLGLFVLYRILRVHLCELDCTFAEAPFMGACRYKCFWEF